MTDITCGVMHRRVLIVCNDGWMCFIGDTLNVTTSVTLNERSAVARRH